MHDEFRRMEQSGNRVMIAVLLAVSLPCLLGAAYTSYRSLWFQYVAEQAQGRIIAKTDDVPQLTVEYRTAGGQTRQVQSAGSDLYENYMVGDRVAVYYDAQQPADVRLGLFVEMWLFPTLLSVFGGFFFLPVVFMSAGQLRRWRSRVDLDRQGKIVQAEYIGYRLTMDLDSFRKRPGELGSVSLSSEDGKHTLIHDGRERDPLDPLVQRELGLRFVAQARWRDPSTGEEHFFESGPVTEHPDKRVRGGSLPVRIDPSNPEHYRFEPPFGPMTLPRSGVIR
mgnify:CR=1 FL=1